ncbi:MAG: isochorismatase family protein [SAR202 cluster bacterium]|nr:isochorismatase family protein [SAR202 cluster bacterium]
MAIWDDLLSDRDRAVYEAYTKDNKVLGKRPVVVVIDVTYGFIGLEPAPILESMKTYRNSCGQEGWDALPRLQLLISTAREAGVPVIYTAGTPSPFRGGGWASRGRGNRDLEWVGEEEMNKRTLGDVVAEEIAPMPGEVLVTKRAASAFSGTPLLQYLNEMDADTLFLAGTTTSGCVRATAVDAACASFFVGVVEECTFDRFELSHKVALMDMHAKYGKVISLDDAQRYITSDAEPILKTGKAQ